MIWVCTAAATLASSNKPLIAGLLAGLYPPLPDDPPYQPSAWGYSDAAQQPRGVAAPSMLGTTSVFAQLPGTAIGAIIASFLLPLLIMSVIRSIGSSAAAHASTLTSVAAALVPIASCLLAEKRLAEQSVSCYLSSMVTCILYIAFLALRLLGAHRLRLSGGAHLFLFGQTAICFGAGWALNQLTEWRDRHLQRRDRSMKCYKCLGVFVPPPQAHHAPVVACPFCGQHNRSPHAHQW